MRRFYLIAGIYLSVTCVLWFMAWTMGFRGGPAQMLVTIGKNMWASTGDGVFNVFWNLVLIVLYVVLVPGMLFWGIAGIVVLLPLALVFGIAGASPFGLILVLAILAGLAWWFVRFVKSLEPFKRP